MKAHFYFTSAIVTVWVQTKWKPADMLLMNIRIITSNLWEVMTWNIEVTGFLKYYFGAEVGQSQPATWYICISPSAFLSLKGEKNQRPILQAVWKWYAIQVSLSINKTSLEHKKKEYRQYFQTPHSGSVKRMMIPLLRWRAPLWC